MSRESRTVIIAIAVLAVVWGGITATVADNRAVSKNGFAWFICGALLGPFGIALAFAPQRFKGTGRECPHCLFWIPGAAMICGYCGCESERGMTEDDAWHAKHGTAQTRG